MTTKDKGQFMRARDWRRNMEVRTAQTIGVHNNLANAYAATTRHVQWLLWSGVAQWLAFGAALWWVL